MSGLTRLGELWGTIRKRLFPMLEDELGELDDKHKEFVAVCETCAPGAHLNPYRRIGNGCPPKSRPALFKAFVAKAVWDFPSTRAQSDAVDGHAAGGRSFILGDDAGISLSLPLRHPLRLARPRLPPRANRRHLPADAITTAARRPSRRATAFFPAQPLLTHRRP